MTITTDSAVQSRVSDLSAGWYNEVARQMGLDTTKFVYAQGGLGLQTNDSSGLFRMSDAVPPATAVAYFDAGGTRQYSLGYGMLLHALAPDTGADLSTVLGDQYASWITYSQQFWVANPMSTLTQVQLFTLWADRNLDPQVAQGAISVFKAAASSPRNRALDAYSDPAGKQQFVDSTKQPYLLYSYSATLDAAQRAVQPGSTVSISFDSKTMDTSLHQKSAKGSVGGLYDIFSAGASASLAKLNETASDSDWTIEGSITYGLLTTQPGSWFDSSQVARAYNAPDDYTVWDASSNQGDWDSFFGQPDGLLARRVTELVIATNYSFTVTSGATFTSDDLTAIKAHASGGIWPFFSASASASSTDAVDRNDEGNLVVEHTLPKGAIQVWGVLVEDAPN